MAGWSDLHVVCMFHLYHFTPSVSKRVTFQTDSLCKITFYFKEMTLSLNNAYANVFSF